MKNKRNLILFIICLTITALMISACHVPGQGGKSTPTEAPAPAATDAPADDEEMLLQNNGSDAAPVDAVPETGDETEGEEDVPMIVNPGRSSLTMPGQRNALGKTASLNFVGSQPSFAAQITRPTASAGGGDGTLTIVNDHTITYPQEQSVIQKSVPTGQLQPLSYIPPSTLANGSSIAFAPGATSAVISGYVPANGTVSYNLYAFANQNFMVLLSSDSGTSVLSINDVYGNYFVTANERKNSYNMYLPRTATYYVNIHSSGYAENFTLQVFIPARVTIPAGQTSVAMNGTVGPYSVVSYTAYMFAGQTARIDDYSGPRPNSFLRVSGLSTGQVYMDYTAYSPSWYSVVPVTQDYLIEVISMDQTSNYRLTVDVR